MQQNQQKVICIVLESAEPALIEKWCQEGKLPVLQQLRQDGVWTRLQSPSYISSGCAWPTLNIGTTPAKHGIGFFHREIKNGTYRIIKKYADQAKGEPFWKRLGEAGFRSAIFDLAATLPRPDTNGVIVVDWGSEHPAWKTSSYPEPLIKDIHREVGRHPLDGWYQQRLDSKEKHKDIADKLIAGVDLRTRALQYILQKDDFDFVCCNYSEPHWAGHIFWHLHDKHHPEHVPEQAAYCGDVILNTYQACDRAVGELVAAFPGANIIVMSNIGIGTHAGGDMMVSEILQRLGVAAESQAPGALKRLVTRILPGASGGPTVAIQRAERLLGPALITRIKKFIPEKLWDNWTRRLLGLGNNWAASRAFLLPGDNSSLIRINLQGREPRGRVQPGDEYQQLCAELAAAFMELVNPATGEQAVERVVILREQLQGEQIDQLPDLAVVWKNFGVPIEALESPRIGRVDIPEFNKRSGGHWHEGFLIGAGPAFRNGVSLELNDLTDVPPTILALFGLSTPAYMDGKVMADAMTATPAGQGESNTGYKPHSYR
jgi:predicted AlkP superfamily phosphohydrolase/phosphomutase